MDIAHIVDRVGSGDGFRSRIDLRFAEASYCARAAGIRHRGELPETLHPRDFNRSTVEEVDALLKGGGSGRAQRQRDNLQSPPWVSPVRVNRFRLDDPNRFSATERLNEHLETTIRFYRITPMS